MDMTPGSFGVIAQCPGDLAGSIPRTTEREKYNPEAGIKPCPFLSFVYGGWCNGSTGKREMPKGSVPSQCPRAVRFRTPPVLFMEG